MVLDGWRGGVELLLFFIGPPGDGGFLVEIVSIAYEKAGGFCLQTK